MLSQASEAVLSNQHVNISSSNMNLGWGFSNSVWFHIVRVVSWNFCFSYVCTGIPHFIAFQLLHFLQIEGCGNCTSSNSIGAIFLTAFVYFMSVCHILVTLPLFQTFSLLYFSKYYITLYSIILHYIIYYSNQWLVIFDITNVIVWGRYESYPYKMANIIDKC